MTEAEKHYTYYLRTYPMVVNIVGCHFDEQVASDYDYKFLRHPEMVALRDPDPEHHSLAKVREELPRLFAGGEAKALLEVDQWYVGAFISEEAAQAFLIRELWDVYFPDEQFETGCTSE